MIVAVSDLDSQTPELSSPRLECCIPPIANKTKHSFETDINIITLSIHRVSYIESQLLPSHQPNPRYGEIIVFAEDEHRSECVLTELLHTLEHPTYQVGCHET